MRRIYMIIVCLVFLTSSYGQNGRLEGKITDAKSGAPVAGVSVTVDGSNTGIGADIDGRYVINLATGRKHIIRFTSVGYSIKELTDVEAFAGQPTIIDVTLESASKTESEVVIRTTVRRETTAALISYQKNTNTVAQVISAEAIRRSPDKNTGEILKRVPGTSVQEGKYLVVRGLSDRYNQAMLNGILLSSTEPDRKTFSYDIFPAAMIDNIIINKAFVPEYPGEWAGGLIQVNTKDVPSSSFLNLQIGTGFNTQTIGADFYTYQGGKYDWLGFDDGKRELPNVFPTKSKFNYLDATDKSNLGKQLQNVWSPRKTNSNFLPVLGVALQLSGGFNQKIGTNNKLGGIFAVTYNRSSRRISYNNAFFGIQNNTASLNFDYHNEKYSKDVLAGALGNLTLQAGNNHKISFKNILNVNATDYVIKRTGKDFESDPTNGENIIATELSFKANTFFNTQLSGDHNIPSIASKLRWYGSFNILDQYIPDQRRIQYNQNETVSKDYLLLISNTRSQKSGSRYFSYLNDYVYTAGGDLIKNFTLFDFSHSVKGGYMFQVKDRLFNSRPFSIYLATDNPSLRKLPEYSIFDAQNFGNGMDNKFGFDELSGNQFRYIANTILNAGYIQFDNQFSDKFRAVWGVRVENYDQVIGSLKQSDPRHIHTRINDFLPGVNLNYKVNNKTNLRLTGSQTVIRPEFRELSMLAFFDFELGATILGNSKLERTKVTNLDLRYELYPRAGELFTAGIFYKYFDKPIELFFNQSGVGTSNTFNYINADKALGLGIEFEFRRKLDFSTALRNFTIQGNFSYIHNRVTKENANLDRPMQGQSPYLANLSVQYDVPVIGLSTTFLFNQIGRRILYVGNQDIPSIWEAPRPLSDLQIAKKVMKGKGEVKLNLSDIINQRAYFYHDIDNNKKYLKSSIDALAINRQYGTNVSVSFGYNIR